ncbi:MAG: undecaprenyl-diphosphate phosphatase [candidate division Zixibacteria bacterium]|nr:undecaprenyl-diphosphate phosphatase [candidate division Zixibacteria bacterium]
MSYLDAIILGILQGLTEFLPVSSSGHLVLTQALLGVKEPGVAFELLVHLGTLLAVVIYFRHRLGRLVASLFHRDRKPERAVVGYLVIGTVPAGVAGVLFKDFFEGAFSNPLMTAMMLFATGLILLSTYLVPAGRRDVSVISSVVMGLGQALAIMPGISRSGSTIAAGMLTGVKPSEAAEFSFLLAIPAIAGAVAFKVDELLELKSQLAGQYLVGTIVSFLFALVAVYTVLAVIKRGKFQYFAYYCFAAGAVGLYLFL